MENFFLCAVVFALSIIKICAKADTSVYFQCALIFSY